MKIIITILVGFIAGVLAKFIHPGREHMGVILTTLLGIGGALVATYGGKALGCYKDRTTAGFIGAIIGAVIILFLYGFIAGRIH